MSKIKNLKFIIILFVTILAFGFSSCYAVDLDLSEDLTTSDFQIIVHQILQVIQQIILLMIILLLVRIQIAIIQILIHQIQIIILQILTLIQTHQTLLEVVLLQQL